MKNSIILLGLIIGLSTQAQTLSQKGNKLNVQKPDVEKPSLEAVGGNSLKTVGTNALTGALQSQANGIIQSLTSKLGLTGNQVAQVTGIVTGLLTKSSSLKDATKISSLISGADTQIKDVLNEDQLGKFSSIGGLLSKAKAKL